MSIKWTNTDLAIFSAFAKMTQKELHLSMKTYLSKYYNKSISTKDFIYCEGNIPVMLVAHMDTVFKKPPKDIYYDPKKFILWSPQGLGADDRAGVFLIWKIIEQGYRPSICLTTDEEVGGIGAHNVIKKFPKKPTDLKYIIELDRQGSNDCVFYSCANQQFENYVEDFGFVTDFGTFTDICIICPQWKIAGVNLSVGYKNEHSISETLNTRMLLDTFTKVCKMLDNINESLYFEYIEDTYEKYYTNLIRRYGSSLFPREDDYAFEMNNLYCQCSKCHKDFLEDDLFIVQTENNGRKYVCLDCIGSNIDWCKKCGEPFEKKDNQEICYSCLRKEKDNG